MTFVAAKCPQCGGDLQLDPEKETGFCMHCGSKIIVQEAIRKVRVDNTHMIDTWMKMGDLAAEAGNNSEAYEYYTKVVEVQPDNWSALYKKGKSAAWQTTRQNNRIPELIQGVQLAQTQLLKLNMNEDESDHINKSFSNDIYNLTKSYSDLFDPILPDLLKTYEANIQLVQDKYNAVFNCIHYLQFALKIMDGLHLQNEDIENTKNLFRRTTVDYCVFICMFWFISNYEGEIIKVWGLPLKEKQQFITIYESCINELRKINPDYFMPDDHKLRQVICRLEPPINNDFMSYYDRNKELEEKWEKDRRTREESLKIRKYWEEHPVEYKTYLEEEKIKKDEIEEKKIRAKKELSEKVIQVEELNKNIDELKKERGKLGIFAGSQKKAIDEKVCILEQELRILKDRIEVLNHF